MKFLRCIAKLCGYLTPPYDLCNHGYVVMLLVLFYLILILVRVRQGVKDGLAMWHFLDDLAAFMSFREPTFITIVARSDPTTF